MGRKNKRIPVQRKNYKTPGIDSRLAEYEMLKRDVVAHLKDQSPENVDRALRQLRERLSI